MRARMSSEGGVVTRRVKACFGLSRAEGNRAVRCLALCTLLNVILVMFLAAVGAATSSYATPAAAAAPPPSSTATGDDNSGGTSSSWRSLEAPEHVCTMNGAVAADEPRCSAVGAEVLRDGGSAVDAAVATALCLGITHPHSSGVGGGAFMVIHLANGTSEVIEFREEAPAAATRDMYIASTPHKSSLLGGLAVAVPTELHGMRVAWERHGTLPWSRLVTPAADLADGFAVGKALARWGLDSC
jgi:gamma-glutamyltranspeptidase